MIVHAARLQFAESEPTEGWVEINDDGIVRNREAGSPPMPADQVIEDGYVISGFVDLHCHGGGGGDFASADPESIRTAAALHESHGTTAMLASLVSAPAGDLTRQIDALVSVIEARDTVVHGIHLEGPFLSDARCGAQNPDHLIEPDPTLFERWTRHAKGHLRMITLAPELPGAMDLIDQAVEAGVVVALGHTDATYEQTMEAIERGAVVATHLYNGMPDLHHREPGVVGAILDSDVPFELIADGVHLHPSTIRIVNDARPERTILVTDAMSAAGSDDGRYGMGGQDVMVTNGVARLSRTNSLAGSTLTMDRAVRLAVESGLTPGQALRAAINRPSELVGGFVDAGELSVGERTRLLHLNDDFTLRGQIVSTQE